MVTTAPMFLEPEQEERESELDAQDEQIKMTNELLDGGEIRQDADIEREYQQKGKRVLLAAEKGDILTLVKYIHQEPSLIDFQDTDGYSALHRASYGGHIDCAKYLVRHGAKIEAKTNDSWRPLHCAVRWNNLNVAEFLVKQGADVNASSSGGNTPLHIVVSNGRYSLTCDIIQLLLFHPECDSHIKNQSGDTPFDISKRSGPFYRLWVGVRTLFADDMIQSDENDSQGG